MEREGHVITDTLDFTWNADDALYQVVDNPYYISDDTNLIYTCLLRQFRPVSFGRYLRRYIYRSAGMNDDFEQVPVSAYQDIIVDAFRERNVPCSFVKTTARLRNVSKNWLTQQAVSRDAVLLLGFGLGMTVDEVNDFLTKALQETKLSPKDPREMICWYCYRKGFGFHRYEHLMNRYLSGAVLSGTNHGLTDLDSTLSLRNNAEQINTDDDLLDYLSKYQMGGRRTKQSFEARNQFDQLYGKCKSMVSFMLNSMRDNDHQLALMRMEEALQRNDQLYDFEKQEKLQRITETGKPYTDEDVQPADIERVFMSAVPKDRNGNMLPMKKSTLNQLFGGRRISRQRIEEIQSGEASITRFDLITLSFFITAGDQNNAPRLHRYSSFIQNTNEVLSRSSMGALNVANPYECFLLMCILADDPLGTFADVWELSYMDRQ